MKTQPDISVVTISYNQAEFLSRAIESVIAQTGVEIEYIILDPGSSDGSRDIIERYKNHFDHIVLEADTGPADALNRGLALSTGKFFYYLNSDDEVEPGAFREALEIIGRDDRTDVLYSNGVAIDENGEIIRKIYSSRNFTPKLYAAGLSVIVQQSAFIRTETLRRIGGFNVTNRTCWDGEAFFDIANSGGKFQRVWKFWGRFRIYATSISGSGSFEERIRADHKRISEKIGADYSEPLARAKKLIMWATERLMDYRRWSSYAAGRFRPTDVTGK